MSVDLLVGSTGFVGSNLLLRHDFQGKFHSTDVQDAFGLRPDLLVYAGTPSAMFLADRDPAADRAVILRAEENIRCIGAKRVALISTVAVYPRPEGVDEDAPIDRAGLPPYGADRRELEEWVETNCPGSLIVRLPAIYGEGLKKNFLFDYLRFIPSLLTDEKLSELSEREPLLRSYYLPQGNGYCICKPLDSGGEKALRAAFERLDFSALRFTDSRSVYQFYPLSRLWDDMALALRAGLPRLNLVAPPVSAGEVFMALEGKPFVNELEKPPYRYDVRTRYAALFGGAGGYVMSRDEEMDALLRFVREQRSRKAWI